ncbi:MAG: DUF2970 domain-containing protein [Burkholderiales bacterium]
MPGEDEKRPASFVDAVKTICWSFFGVRRRAQHEVQTVKLKPVHVIVAGVIGAAIFVVVLVTVAKLIVGAGG